MSTLVSAAGPMSTAIEGVLLTPHVGDPPQVASQYRLNFSRAKVNEVTLRASLVVRIMLEPR